MDISRLSSRVRQWGRRYLPSRCKYWLKKILPLGLEAPVAKIPLPLPNNVEQALRLWFEDPHLIQARQSVMACDRSQECVSIVLVTYNNLSLTRLCLESIYKHTNELPFELIIVDNKSQDGTCGYLKGLQDILPNLRVILNPCNEGFARANNRGLMEACGDYIVLLNNDTIVGWTWLSRLLSYLRQDPTIGLVGPVTNSAGNEQMIPARYSSIEELERFAEQRLKDFEGRYFEIDSLAMFCVVFRRRLIDEIGLLDERFGLGTFEDDDFCHRAKLRGYKLICAEDVFVHHFGRGTTRSWGDREYLKLFEHNRRLFERKWGVRWRPARLRI